MRISDWSSDVCSSDLDYALGNHVAPLGLSFADKVTLGGPYANGAFVGLHGRWNRKPRSGYKVVFVPFGDNGETGKDKPIDVLTGFLSPQETGRASCRERGCQTVEVSGGDGTLQ